MQPTRLILLVSLGLLPACATQPAEPVSGYFPIALAQRGPNVWLASTRLDEKAANHYRLDLYMVPPAGEAEKSFGVTLGNTLAGNTPPLFAGAITGLDTAQPSIVGEGYYEKIGFAIFVVIKNSYTKFTSMI